MPRKRQTPIEEYIEGGKVMTAKERYDNQRKADGFVRRAYWIHRDDVSQVAELVKELDQQRKPGRD